LGCYGVKLTRHGHERIEGGAGKGEENRFSVRKAGELVIVDDWELDRSDVQSLAGLANQVAYVKVGLVELREEDCADGALEEFLEEGRGGRSSIVTIGDQGREA